jgi:hypothetical protein
MGGRVCTANVNTCRTLPSLPTTGVLRVGEDVRVLSLANINPYFYTPMYYNRYAYSNSLF